MALAASADSVNTTNEPGRSYLGPARLSGQKKVYVKKTVLPNTSADTFHDHKYIRTNSPHNYFLTKSWSSFCILAAVFFGKTARTKLSISSSVMCTVTV